MFNFLVLTGYKNGKVEDLRLNPALYRCMGVWGGTRYRIAIARLSPAKTPNNTVMREKAALHLYFGFIMYRVMKW